MRYITLIIVLFVFLLQACLESSEPNKHLDEVGKQLTSDSFDFEVIEPSLAYLQDNIDYTIRKAEKKIKSLDQLILLSSTINRNVITQKKETIEAYLDTVKVKANYPDTYIPYDNKERNTLKVMLNKLRSEIQE